MHAHFDQVAEKPHTPAEHHTYLQRLHGWIKGLKQQGDQSGQAAEAPKSTAFKETGGTLEIHAAGRDTAAAQIIVHHGGELVA